MVLAMRLFGPPAPHQGLQVKAYVGSSFFPCVGGQSASVCWIYALEPIRSNGFLFI
jgi:hypothetical protein